MRSTAGLFGRGMVSVSYTTDPSEGKAEGFPAGIHRCDVTAKPTQGSSIRYLQFKVFTSCSALGKSVSAREEVGGGVLCLNPFVIAVVFRLRTPYSNIRVGWGGVVVACAKQPRRAMEALPVVASLTASITLLRR